MEYVQEITLDLNSNTAYTTVGAKQGDVDSRILVVHITQNGEDYIIPLNTQAYFRLRKPDGKAVLNECVVDNPNNVIRIRLTQQALAASGRGYADIVLYGQNQEVLSTVSFILIIMSSPGVVEEVLSSNEFGYLQAIVDDATTVINESEAWAVGTRSGIAVVGNSFNYNLSGGVTSIEIDENTFKEKVGIYPGATNQYKFKFDGLDWIYTNAENEIQGPVTLAEFGITVLSTYFDESQIVVTVTDADLQYQNNAKYYANLTTNAQESINNLEIQATTEGPDVPAYVVKDTENDTTVRYSSTNLGTVTVATYEFSLMFNEYGDYDFYYNGSAWTYNNTIINLSECGITYTGTPISGNKITIGFNYHVRFNFHVPQGEQGEYGFDAASATASSLPAGLSPTVTAALDTSAPSRTLSFAFGIPAADGEGARSIDGVTADASGRVNLYALRYADSSNSTIEQSLTASQKAQVCANIGAIAAPGNAQVNTFLSYNGTTWIPSSINQVPNPGTVGYVLRVAQSGDIKYYAWTPDATAISTASIDSLFE